ncbi:bifunctional peptidase and arginyl-hydroxylase JMJD5-like [Dysidea avara]|uniref:bifunctional peptidase and arginyl-hydroxylase JMJD5-like n=1 Tax=Dysidea avara TaxID=196820 RepID=UPI00332B506A
MRFLILLQFISISIGTNQDDLPGHMQPIGSHRPPEESILVINSVPDPLEFYEKYMGTHTPVLMKGAIAGTPAVTKWINDEYLSDSFGEEPVDLEVGKKENRTGDTDETTMAEFLKRYKSEDIYLVNDMPMGMQQEWMVPRCLLCGGYTEYFNFCYIWFSSGGTKSVLHTDAYQNLHCLTSGIKEFVLIPPEYIEIIGPEHGLQGYYDIDVEKVNMTSHPGMMEVPWYYVRVEPGDCLFIPFNWIHHVASHGRNLGVNIWWSWFEFQRKKCPEDLSEVPPFMPLAQFKLRPEKQILAMFTDIARDDGYAYAEDLLATLPPEYDKETMLHVFDLLDPGCNGKLLVSKLLDDEFLEERYQVLRAFIEPSDIEDQYEDDMDDDGPISYNNNDDWDGDIQVPSEAEVNKFVKRYSREVDGEDRDVPTSHNEL